jgi:hypothetical protein
LIIENKCNYDEEYKGQLSSSRRITIIRITTINEITLTKEIRRTWCTTVNTTFGDFGGLIKYLNGIFLVTKKKDDLKKFFISGINLTAQKVCDDAQVTAVTNAEELS